MSEAAIHRGWSMPLASRLSRATVLAPVGFVAIVALIYLTAWVFYANVFWEMQGLSLPALRFEEGSWRARLHEALILGYTAAMSTWSLRGAVRRLNEIRPALRSSGTEFRQQLLDLTTLPRWRWLGMGICGAAVVAAGPPENPTWSHLWTESGVLQPEFVWGLGMQSLLGWLMLRAVAIDIHIARSFRRIGEQAASLDLLDLRSLEPFTRVGLRTVFLWIIWFSILSLAWVGRGPRSAEMWALIPIVVVVTTALLVPALGVRHRIRTAKRAELDSIDQRIRRERDVIRDGSELGGSSMPALVAYRSLIERVREWPFDPSTLLRFGLAMGLLLGSWLGGAVVERILGRVLG